MEDSKCPSGEFKKYEAFASVSELPRLPTAVPAAFAPAAFSSGNPTRVPHFPRAARESPGARDRRLDAMAPRRRRGTDPSQIGAPARAGRRSAPTVRALPPRENRSLAIDRRSSVRIAPGAARTPRLLASEETVFTLGY